MLYIRLILAFFYYFLRPKTFHYSPLLFIVVLLFGLLGVFFVFYRGLSFSVVSLAKVSPTPHTTFPSKYSAYIDAEREMLRKNQTVVHQMLVTYPTSRDLWIYNGWIALSLNDVEEITKTTEMLMLIDPNNPQVRLFLEQL